MGIGSGILGGRFGFEDREGNNGRDKDLARGREGVAIRWLISQIISNNLDLNSQQNQKNAQVN